MKRLTVIAAGLGYRLLERHALTEMAGLRFEPQASVFPALTCVAQATLRTSLPPSRHGMLANGVWLDGLQKPFFWDQSSCLVKGPRIWGRSTGLFFIQQSLGEDVDVIVSPAPIHRHGGGLTMACYTKPSGLAGVLERRCGTFPLWRYWGPLASAKVGRACLRHFEAAMESCDVDDAFLYLPTLDYAAQRSGPDSPAAKAALVEFVRQLEQIVLWASQRGCSLTVVGDYGISAVTLAPVSPNVELRRAGLFRTRDVGGRAYPDFFSSSAFALCDHEVAVILGPDRDKAVELLLATGGYELSADQPGAEQGKTVLLAKEGSWCEYRWWDRMREAPDYARHVDIHNKPGFDPAELFFRCSGVVKGTHGRQCEVAFAQA